MVIGKILSIDELMAGGYDAVFIGSGAGLPRFMNIPGEGLVGVCSANEYLTRINLMHGYDPKYATPVIQSKVVAVVGGGNVAMDAARSALRMGAEHVYIVYRRSEAEMPARLEEVHHAKEEGVEFQNLCNPVEILGDENGRVNGEVHPHGTGRTGRKRQTQTGCCSGQRVCPRCRYGYHGDRYFAESADLFDNRGLGHKSVGLSRGQRGNGYHKGQGLCRRRCCHRCGNRHSGDGCRKNSRCVHRRSAAQQGVSIFPESAGQTEKGLLNMSKNFARLGLAASTAALTGAVCSMTAFASGTSSTSTSGGGFGTVGYLIFMVLLFAVMYFILIRPQKKKDKEAKAMQDSLQVGDEIVTIGGIVGLVVQVNEDNIVIETTSNRNKLRIKNWAVQENLTMTENAKRKQEAQIAAAKEKKASKKKKKGSDDSDQGMLEGLRT